MPSIAPELGTVASPLHRDGDDSGVYQTSPGLLRRVALAQWAEGLAQYLALRLGDAHSGRRAYAQLTRRVKALPADELIANPGPKAQLYRLARYVADKAHRAEDGALPWRKTSGPSGALRDAFDAEDSELLELRHARELSVSEIAFVLDWPADQVEFRLDTAEARGRRILGADAPDPLSARATAFVEAFALERRWQDDGAPTASLEIEPDVSTLDPGTLIGGRYQLVEQVGTGSFGDVYRAQDIEVAGHEVALKLLRQPSLSETARRAALRELKLNAAVFHPSLVQFKDHGWFEQRLWFVMPWYEGETLEARMAHGPLGRAEAARIFEPLARALAALHEAGIRHQDIKPENILLTRLPGYASHDGILPVLIDLGVAAEEKETMLGGTPLYFAPEVARRFMGTPPESRDVDFAADVFALALSLRNALEPDTQDDVPAGAVQAFVERRGRSLPPLPKQRDLRYLRPTLARWLSLDPEERPSAETLAEELRVLTLPEDRRARRLRIAQWVLPLVVLFALVFSAAVYALSERAETEGLRAERAQQEAADVRADLIVENARRSALEEGRATLLARYEESRLTRGELANELATVEGQVNIMRAQLAQTLRDRAELSSQVTRSAEALESTRREQVHTAAQLAETRQALQTSRASESRLSAELDASGRRAAAQARELAERVAERDDARRQSTALRAQLTDAEHAAEEAETEAEDTRHALEASERRAQARAAELARVRQRIDALAATLAGPASASAAAAAPSEDAPPSPAEPTP